VEYALLLATFGLVMAFGLEAGIAAGILLAALHFAYRCGGGEGLAWGDEAASACPGAWAWLAVGVREALLICECECRCQSLLCCLETGNRACCLSAVCNLRLHTCLQTTSSCASLGALHLLAATLG